MRIAVPAAPSASPSISISVLAFALLTACGRSGSVANTDAGGATGTGGDPTGGTATGGTATGGTTSSGGASATGGAPAMRDAAIAIDAPRAELDAAHAMDAAAPQDGAVDGLPTATNARCPAGPFPTPAMLSMRTVCADFAFKYDSNEGATWIASQNAFFFSNYAVRQASGGDIIKYTPGGACETFIADVGCNGLAVTNDGNLLAACQQSRSVIRFDVATKQATTLATGYMGMLLDSPNDLVMHTNGTIYFTNPTYELGARPPGVGLAVFRLDPAGALSMIAQGTCNGIALSPDEKKLYVLLAGQTGQAGQGGLGAPAGVWDVDATGIPTNRGTLAVSGDGMGVDCAGNLYTSGTIFSEAGGRLGTYAGNGTNLAFGGADSKTMLVVGRGQMVRELQMNVPGLP